MSKRTGCNENQSRGLVRLLSLLMFTVWAVSHATADVIVIGSSVPGLNAGTVLTDEKTIQLPAGERVRLMLPSGKTQSFSGPKQIRVSSLAGGGQKADQGLWDDVKRLASQQKKPIESAVGAARSVAPPKPGARESRGQGPTSHPAFSWRGVPVDADGSVCVEKGARLQLQRQRAGRTQVVSVAQMQSGKRAMAEFATGAVAAPWPQGLQAEAGFYIVSLSGAPIRQINLVSLPRLPSSDETLRVLYAHGCRAQMATWLSSQG